MAGVQRARVRDLTWQVPPSPAVRQIGGRGEVCKLGRSRSPEEPSVSLNVEVDDARELGP